MAMIALKCPHIEVSEPRQRARAFFIFLFSFSPKEEREKILFSLSERTRAPEILLVVFLSRRWCLSPSLSRIAAFRSRSLFIGRERRAQFFYLSSRRVDGENVTLITN